MNGVDIVALIAAFGGLATGLGAFWKARADNASVLSSVAVSLVEPLQKRIEALEAEVARLRAENAHLREQIYALQVENQILRDGVRRLAGQIQSLGHRPVWQPPKEEE